MLENNLGKAEKQAPDLSPQEAAEYTKNNKGKKPYKKLSEKK